MLASAGFDAISFPFSKNFHPNELNRVIAAYELITGQNFVPAKNYSSNDRMQKNLDSYFR